VSLFFRLIGGPNILWLVDLGPWVPSLQRGHGHTLPGFFCLFPALETGSGIEQRRRLAPLRRGSPGGGAEGLLVGYLIGRFGPRVMILLGPVSRSGFHPPIHGA